MAEYMCKNSSVCLALCKRHLNLKRRTRHGTGQCARAAWCGREQGGGSADTTHLVVCRHLQRTQETANSTCRAREQRGLFCTSLYLLNFQCMNILQSKQNQILKLEKHRRYTGRNKRGRVGSILRRKSPKPVQRVARPGAVGRNGSEKHSRSQ